MSLNRRRPENRKDRRRKTSRGQRERSQGAGRELFLVLGAFALVILALLIALIFFSG